MVVLFLRISIVKNFDKISIDCVLNLLMFQFCSLPTAERPASMPLVGLSRGSIPVIMSIISPLSCLNYTQTSRLQDLIGISRLKGANTAWNDSQNIVSVRFCELIK
jgi:hypothetical protein